MPLIIHGQAASGSPCGKEGGAHGCPVDMGDDVPLPYLTYLLHALADDLGDDQLLSGPPAGTQPNTAELTLPIRKE
jgi:hypothetical protein